MYVLRTFVDENYLTTFINTSAILGGSPKQVEIFAVLAANIRNLKPRPDFWNQLVHRVFCIYRNINFYKLYF